MTTQRPFTRETLTGDFAQGQFPEVRFAMLEFVGQFLLDFERAAERAGLTLAQARVLGFAALKPSSMREIAEQFGCDPSNITAKADKLLELGLVRRFADPRDARIKLIGATDAGFEMSKNMCESREWIAEVLASLTDDELTTVRTALQLLTRPTKAMQQSAAGAEPIPV
ncbi:MarR family transcriptional regulator [Arthrobacter crusticola]|uniref:MarR family transcriptional regulator n=1 Tax=Arthrobacter crusticola TaxID=2547960 RepID=A0A4R5TTZ2_9MICC|nr:MarR family transcriptional regulator [Arthrobacter crusticola]TDK24493.1 MarR family transcriptional regulator [Arthrobacter crusticola]